jgi:hypothetical protein
MTAFFAESLLFPYLRTITVLAARLKVLLAFQSHFVISKQATLHPRQHHRQCGPFL